jgi:uncharacterized protein
MKTEIPDLSSQQVVRILVFSDSHGRLDFMRRCVAKHPEVDLVVHLGDLCSSYGDLAGLLKKPLAAVAGNCDGSLYGSQLPNLLVFNLAGRRFLATHGHLYGVKQQLGPLLDAAAAQPQPIDVILFGHTHQMLDRTIDWHGRKFLLLNPGNSRGGMMAPASALFLVINPLGISRRHLLD